MSVLSVQSPFPIFTDTDGDPLESGYIWIGVANLDPQVNPLAVFWDAALTMPAVQPIRTLAGYPSQAGSPGRLYTTADHSIRVQNKRGTTVFTAGNVKDRFSADLIGYVGPDGLDYAVQDLSNNTNVAKGSSLVGYKPNFLAANGVAERTVSDKLKEFVSVRDFGATGLGIIDEKNAFDNAYSYCVANGFDLKIPAGRYKISGNWSLGAALGAAALRDCKGVTIHGDGPDTVIFSQALDGKGADVIQINSAKNLRIRHLALESVVVDFTGAGSNGISITNGFDNILIEDIFCKNLPYVDKTTYLDGGKAITVQSDVASTLNHGVLRVESLYALGCVYGFNVDATLDKWLGGTMSPSIIADVFADSCYSGIAISGFAVTPPFPDSSSCNVKIKATCKDCQTAITIVRFYGLSADVTILNTKTIANKRLNPDGGPWSTADNVVYGIYATSPINSLINVKGFIGECDYKITLGSVLDIKGDNNQILFDIGGTSLVSDIDPIIAGGNLLSNSMIEVSNATAASIPNDFYTPSYNNVLIYGTSNITSKSLVLRDFLGFSESDGVTCNYKLKRGDFSLAAQQTLGGTPTLRIFEYQNNAGTAVTAILNNGSLSTSALNTAATVATIKAVMVIYDLSGAIVGYVPVYTSYAT